VEDCERFLYVLFNTQLLYSDLVVIIIKFLLHFVTTGDIEEAPKAATVELTGSTQAIEIKDSGSRGWSNRITGPKIQTGASKK